MDLMDRIMDLSRCGYFCSQILGVLLMETLGEDNPKLVQALAGLNGGVGYSGGVCGCMTAGCCLISYFTGKSAPTEYESPHHKGALGEFTGWFTEEMELEHSSVECRDITGGKPAKRLEYCPEIIASTYEKCMEILENRGLI